MLRLILLIIIILVDGVCLAADFLDYSNISAISEHGFRWKRSPLYIKINGEKEYSLPLDKLHNQLSEDIINLRLDFNLKNKNTAVYNAVEAINKKNWAFMKISVIKCSAFDAEGDHEVITILNANKKENIFLSGQSSENELNMMLSEKLISQYNQSNEEKNLLLGLYKDKLQLFALLKKLVNDTSKILKKCPKESVQLGKVKTYIQDIISISDMISKYEIILDQTKFIEYLIEARDRFLQINTQVEKLKSSVNGPANLVKAINHKFEIIEAEINSFDSYIKKLQNINSNIWREAWLMLEVETVIKNKSTSLAPSEMVNRICLILQNNVEGICKIINNNINVLKMNIDIDWNNIDEALEKIKGKIENFTIDRDARKYAGPLQYLDTLQANLIKKQNKLLDSEQWIRLFLYTNAERIYHDIDKTLKEKQKNFADYSLMLINVGNYYDMCPRCTATWSLESILGNDHDLQINAQAKEFSFCSKFNSLRAQNNQKMLNYVVVGSSIETTTEGAIRRYEQGHDGYHEYPIEIPDFLPLMAFRMPEGTPLKALPRYKDSSSLKRIIPNYWPNISL